jgi:hypothetical protein
MSSNNLDIEFEQVLGSWLDHCSESLSLQDRSSPNENETRALQLLKKKENTGMLLLSPTSSSQIKESDAALKNNNEEEEEDDDDDDDDDDDSSWLSSTRPTLDRFKSMIPDNMEKLREMFKVVFLRLRFSSIRATRQFLDQNIQVALNNNLEHENDEDIALKSSKSENNDSLIFFPKRFLLSNSNSSSSTIPTLEPSLELSQLIRRSLFFWLVFDTLLQTFPLVICQWSQECKNEFFNLIEFGLP